MTGKMMDTVYWRASKSLYVMNIGLQHDSRQLNIVVYWRLWSILSQLKIGSKLHLRQMKKFVHGYRHSASL